MADEENTDPKNGAEDVAVADDKPAEKADDKPADKPKKAKKKKKAEPNKKEPKKKKVDPRDAILAKLFVDSHKMYKGKLLAYASDVKIEGGIPRIPTGVLPLDLATVGGLAIGRQSVFYGHKSTSKTATYLRAAGLAQRHCSNCWTPAFPLWLRSYSGLKPKCKCGDYRRCIIAWIDVEGAWDDLWYQRFLDLSKVVKSQPSVAEQAIDICVLRLSNSTGTTEESVHSLARQMSRQKGTPLDGQTIKADVHAAARSEATVFYPGGAPSLRAFIDR